MCCWQPDTAVWARVATQAGVCPKWASCVSPAPHPVYLLPPSKWSSVCAHARAVEVVKECKGVYAHSSFFSGGTDTQQGPEVSTTAASTTLRQHARQTLPTPLSVAFAVVFSCREADAQTLRQEAVRRLRMQPWVERMPCRLLIVAFKPLFWFVI